MKDYLCWSLRQLYFIFCWPARLRPAVVDDEPERFGKRFVEIIRYLLKMLPWVVVLVVIGNLSIGYVCELLGIPFRWRNSWVAVAFGAAGGIVSVAAFRAAGVLAFGAAGVAAFGVAGLSSFGPAFDATGRIAEGAAYGAALAALFGAALGVAFGAAYGAAEGSKAATYGVALAIGFGVMFGAPFGMALRQHGGRNGE
jgi:hypothetical protein